MKRGGATPEALEALIGYHFHDKQLLDLALTHVSAVAGARSRAKSYQRLEFLGDRVLGLAIASLLYREFPTADEGDLSKRLAELVRRESCAVIAESWRLGD
ncbi:MAG: ribonuclease III, partial [Hyphomicrobiales bacterium]|nr:ribonuclease III [Hyphomicrobiales bacterium]